MINYDRIDINIAGKRTGPMFFLKINNDLITRKNRILVKNFFVFKKIIRKGPVSMNNKNSEIYSLLIGNKNVN